MVTFKVRGKQVTKTGAVFIALRKLAEGRRIVAWALAKVRRRRAP